MKGSFSGRETTEHPAVSRQRSVVSPSIAIVAGIAAASIISHGMAAHTTSLAKLWTNVGEREGSRRELQIAINIAANTPAANSVHIARTTNLIGSHRPRSPRLPHYLRLSQRCIRMSSSSGIMLWFNWRMTHIEPNTIRQTMRTPKAKARMLLALSGAVVMWRKKMR
jgi:hypothetical protein